MPTSGDALGCGVKIVCWFSVAHIVQLLCSAPASETVEGAREGVEGGRMQDARQRRRVPTADCAEKIRQLACPTAFVADLAAVGQDVHEQGRKAGRLADGMGPWDGWRQRERREGGFRALGAFVKPDGSL
jgi:hypothetical protein